MGGRVNQPGRVKRQGSPHENGPQYKFPSAKGEQCRSNKDERNEKETVEPDIEPVLHQVRGVMPEYAFLVALSAASQDPTDVRPQAAVTRRMRITFTVGVGVVDSMGNDPLYWTALQRESAAYSKEVF